KTRRKVDSFYKKSVKNKNRNETIRILIVSLRFFYLRLVFSQPLSFANYFRFNKNIAILRVVNKKEEFIYESII
ncbi:MAG: hypothetical protein Q4Q13_07575, partial [Vagococcus sp.]|nr:hypothetical protein [Vagococcus sp.]